VQVQGAVAQQAEAFADDIGHALLSPAFDLIA
jgi:hypothetical protein